MVGKNMKIIDKETKKSDFYGIPIQTERRNDLTIDILSAYYSEHHHCNVSARTSFDGIALGKRVKSLIADFDLIEALNICINLQCMNLSSSRTQHLIGKMRKSAVECTNYDDKGLTL